MSEGTEVFKIVTANTLRDGIIVYMREADGQIAWLQNITDATSFDEESIDAALERAKKFEESNELIGVYPIEVTGRNRPMSAREHIRARGPSVKYGIDAVQPDFSI